jgi:hypothetical protein
MKGFLMMRAGILELTPQQVTTNTPNTKTLINIKIRHD